MNNEEDMKTQKETLEQALDVFYKSLVKLENAGALSHFPILFEEDDKIDEVLCILDSLREDLNRVKGDSQHES